MEGIQDDDGRIRYQFSLLDGARAFINLTPREAAMCEEDCNYLHYLITTDPLRREFAFEGDDAEGNSAEMIEVNEGDGGAGNSAQTIEVNEEDAAEGYSCTNTQVNIFNEGGAAEANSSEVNEVGGGEIAEGNSSEVNEVGEAADVRAVWTHNNILALIEAFKAHKAKFSSNIFKKTQIWQIISREVGRTPVQCQAKFKYLKMLYIKKKDNMGPGCSGARNIKFPYFDEFDSIFRREPNVRPVALASSSSCAAVAAPQTVITGEPVMTAGPARPTNPPRTVITGAPVMTAGPARPTNPPRTVITGAPVMTAGPARPTNPPRTVITGAPVMTAGPGPTTAPRTCITVAPVMPAGPSGAINVGPAEPNNDQPPAQRRQPRVRRTRFEAHLERMEQGMDRRNNATMNLIAQSMEQQERIADRMCNLIEKVIEKL